MNTPRTIFLSAVSNEFHHVAEGQSHRFPSYRQVLREAFRTLARHYEVIDQESLPAGFGDLLATLDHEIERSLIVVHLVGEMAGYAPEQGPLRKLHARHPDLLAELPDLRAAIGDGAGISYTQWELYLAFHYDRKRLIFEAQPTAPRSPRFAPTPGDVASQEAHRRRVAGTDDHRVPFLDQGDVARKSMRTFLHFRIDPLVDSAQPDAEALAEAWANDKNIVDELAAAIKKPDPRAVPVTDPANVAAFVAAVRATAERWGVNLATIVDIAARYEQAVRVAAEARPTPETLHDVAFANLALGDYTAGRFWAQRAADLALQLREERPAEAAVNREFAQNALLLLHEAAKAAHDIPAAITALEQAGGLIDKENDPLLWADVHEPLAGFLLDHARWARADELISEILDIREEHQGENHVAVAKTLLVWSALLHQRSNYAGMQAVARRAENICASQTPPDLTGVAAALNNRAQGLQATNRLVEAEPLMRRALAITEESFGPEHPKLAIRLNNLAQLLKTTNRLAEAEPMMRRALAIDEESFGPEHPAVARDLNNLAMLLKATNRLAEAELLFQRALVINERSFGPEHPAVAAALNSLAALLHDMNRLTEAEPLMRRALAIDEQSSGPDHPDVAIVLNNLAQLLKATNRLAEAELLMRRALAINEQSLGPDHPDVAIRLNNLAQLLQATNRLAEAEALMRRALAIDEESFGPDHPDVAIRLNNLAQLLQATNRLVEAEPLMRRALAIDEQSFGPEHPAVAANLNNLAALFHAMNRLAEAEPLVRRAVAIDEQSFGPEHPAVAVGLNNLAAFLQETNRLAEAEPLMRRALAIDEQSFGPEHPKVAIRLNNLAQLLKATTRLAEAEPLMRRALAIDEQSLGPEHPEIATRLNNLALLLQATNRLAEAEPLMGRAVKIYCTFTRTTGRPHPYLQSAVDIYAGLLSGMGQSEEQILARLRELAPQFF